MRKMPEEGGREVVRRMEKKEREVVRRRIERMTYGFKANFDLRWQRF